VTPTTSPSDPDLDGTDTGDGTSESTPAPAPRTSPVATAVTAAAAAITLIAAVVLSIFWFLAYQESSDASLRDDALAGARQAAINLNSVDSNDLDKTFADIESSITGDELTNGLNDTKDQFRQQFAETGVVTTAAVQHASLVGFSSDDGTAQSLVVLTTDTTKPDGNERYQSTLRLELQDVDGTWKATRIQPIGQRIPLEVPGAPAATGDPAAPTDPAATDPAAPVDPAAPADPAAPVDPAPAPTDGGQ
jgi:Mce-associated membrane protein